MDTGSLFKVITVPGWLCQLAWSSSLCTASFVCVFVNNLKLQSLIKMRNVILNVTTLFQIQHLNLKALISIHLQEAYDNVTMDVELSRREGWHFAAKLVRGAYMYQERERAEEMGYEDPINPDYESTNRMYHR